MYIGGLIEYISKKVAAYGQFVLVFMLIRIRLKLQYGDRDRKVYVALAMMLRGHWIRIQLFGIQIFLSPFFSLLTWT